MAQILHDLGINPNALLINIIGFLILLWMMKKMLFKPVGSFLEGRKRKIADDLDGAQQARTEAEAELARVRERRQAMLDAVEGEAEAARQQAQAEAEALRQAARTSAREAELSARAATERERRDAEVQLRGTTAEAASAMCRRILQTTLTEERHRALLDQFIGDVERMAAQQGPQ